MSKMTRFFCGTVFAVVLLFGVGALSPQAAQAASLTSAQISAIIGLLQSFGADQTTINNVQTALGGTSTGGGTKTWCHTFNSDLTVGSTDADVSALNKALSSSGIDTTGNSSSFTENTAGDVVQFQAKYGIRQTGYVGPITRAKLNKLYGCSNPVPPSTFSASPTSGSAPLAVMFYSNAQGGTVNFGDGTPSTSLECDTVSAANSSSVSSACLRTFAKHTYIANGTYTATLQALPQCAVYVGQTDSSNCKPVTIGKVTITVGTIVAPTISSLKPTYGPVGTSVTITGNGFTSTNNSVKFGGGYLNGISSNGTAITFTVPDGLTPCAPNAEMCAMSFMQVKPGVYPVSVINASGTSNTVIFTVTSKIETLSINPTSAIIKVGTTTEFQALFNNCPSDDQCFVGPLPVRATWTSSNPKVAAIAYKEIPCPAGSYCFAQQFDYLTAVVTGVSLGTATITATYKDSSGAVFTASAPVSTVMQ